MTNVQIYPDAGALMRAAAELFITIADEATAARGRFSVALSGGSTPRALYKLLALDGFARQVDWSKVNVFWGDERAVPPDHEWSNYRMAREALLDHVPIPEVRIYRIPGELSPTLAADVYQRMLKEFFGEANPPRFDLVLLGMGGDGHIASLFPDVPLLHETGRWVAAAKTPAGISPDVARITFTPVVLNAAANVVFLVQGPDKAARLKAVLEGPHKPDELPAQVVKPVDGRLVWLVDKAAHPPVYGAVGA
ncbi:MAG: 6-phosphogluconolactonase [Anaerolineae bacterium]|nr:6-phosphogluconolactonase [Anaerolineae bacterium]